MTISNELTGPKEFLTRTFSYKEKIITQLDVHQKSYEAVGKKRVRCLHIAAKVILYVLIPLATISSSTLPIFLGNLSWLPWAGIGGFFFFLCVHAILETIASIQEKKARGQQFLKGMLESREIHPFCEANLSKRDERLFSDRLKGEFSANHPPHADHIAHVEKDYDLDAEICSRAYAARVLSNQDDPYLQKPWKKIRSNIKSANQHFTYQPGYLKKAVFTIFPCLRPSLQDQLDNYVKKLDQAKRRAYQVEGALSHLIDLNIVSRPKQEDLSHFAQMLLRRYDADERKWAILQSIYDEGKSQYAGEVLVPEEAKQVSTYENIQDRRIFQKEIDLLRKALEENPSEPSKAGVYSHFRAFRRFLKFTQKTDHSLEEYRSFFAEMEKEERLKPLIAAFGKKFLVLFLYSFVDPALDPTKSVELLSSISTFKPLAENLCLSPETITDLRQVCIEKRSEEEVASSIAAWLEQNGQKRASEALETLGVDLQGWEKELAKELKKIEQDFQRIFPHGIPETVQAEERWLKAIGAKVTLFSKAREEVLQEVEKWILHRPFPLIEEADFLLKQIIMHPNFEKHRKKIVKLEKRFEKIKSLFDPSKSQKFYEKVREQLIKIHKEIKTFAKRINGPSTTERISLVFRHIFGKKKIATPSFEIPSSPYFHGRKIRELKVFEALKKIDLSIIKTFRFKRLALDWLAVTVMLVVEAFFLSNAWVGLGVTFGIVGVLACRHIVDFRLHQLNDQKKALRMEEKILDPVPKEKAYEFEKDHRRVQSIGSKPPSNLSELAKLKEWSARLGLDGTERREARLLISSSFESDYKGYKKGEIAPFNPSHKEKKRPTEPKQLDKLEQFERFAAQHALSNFEADFDKKRSLRLKKKTEEINTELQKLAVELEKKITEVQECKEKVTELCQKALQRIRSFVIDSQQKVVETFLEDLSKAEWSPLKYSLSTVALLFKEWNVLTTQEKAAFKASEEIFNKTDFLLRRRKQLEAFLRIKRN